MSSRYGLIFLLEFLHSQQNYTDIYSNLNNKRGSQNLDRTINVGKLITIEKHLCQLTCPVIGNGHCGGSGKYRKYNVPQWLTIKMLNFDSLCDGVIDFLSL